MLTEQIRPFRFALVAFAPVRLSALNYKKTSADRSGSLFAIVDGRISEVCEHGLISMGFKVLKLPRDIRLSEAVSSHTDLLLFHHKNTFIGSREYFERNKYIRDVLMSEVKNADIRLTDEKIGCQYPLDAIFNALVIGNKIFAKTDTVSKEIISYANEAKLKIVHVNQGYPACTVLAVGEKLAITSDMGMKAALEKENIEVLYIENSKCIKLPPYKFGFIGGSGSVFGNKVYFLGNLCAVDRDGKIRQRLSDLGYTPISLDTDSDSLFDLGGMILISV